MLDITNVEVTGWEAAIRGMRNPMNSWDKSDTEYTDIDWYGDIEVPHKMEVPDIGPNDHDLMMKLAGAGSDHRKYLRMIHVSMDVDAPQYWWSQFDQYRIATVTNSTSKMHRMLAEPFSVNDFSFDHIPGYKKNVNQQLPWIDYEEEEWRKIDREPSGHWTDDKGYSVSSEGRVRNNNTGKILAGVVQKDNYIHVTIYGVQYRVHRLVAEAFIENPEGKSEVDHINGNKMDNRVLNLRWATSSENQQYAVNNHLQPKRSHPYTGKFSEDERNEIKRLWNEENLSMREIARRYNVSHTCISRIINNTYRYAAYVNLFEKLCIPLVDTLNELRDAWLIEEDENKKKDIWYTILSLLPMSYNQLRTVDLNYEVLRNIYFARRGHKLDEWHTFCEWIETLPYHEIITEVE